MTKNSIATNVLRALLALLSLGWLILFIKSPINLNPDSYGYLQDAEHLFDPGYQTIRPVLFPAWLRLVNTLHIKSSIAAYFLNTASLLYLVYISGGKTQLFSRRNTILLIAFFLLRGIWSYVGTCLTESILLSVGIWIFIFLVRILFPEKERSMQPLLVTGYSILISLLAITLKPWIMIMVLLIAAMSLLASLTAKTFKRLRLSAFILLLVSALSFAVSLGYNRSKSGESPQMVLLMVSSGNEGKLEERLISDKGLTSDSAQFIRTLLDDIDRIRRKYHGSPYPASTANDLRLLNVLDKAYTPSIQKAFHLMYLERPRDGFDLALLAFERYISQMKLGLACLDVAYGPELPGLHAVAIPLILIGMLLALTYAVTRRDPATGSRTGIRPLLQYLADNRRLTIFTGIVLLAGIIFMPMLCLAGGDELQRCTLPPIPFQMFALTFILLRPQKTTQGPDAGKAGHKEKSMG